MASSQNGNGFTQIPNEILEALCKVNLSPYESRVLLYLMRKTFGWHKKMDRIALSQYSEDLRIDRRLVHRTLRRLSSRQMIVIRRDDRNSISYGFQEDIENWKGSSPKMPVISSDDKTVISADTHKINRKKNTVPDSPNPEFDNFYRAYPKQKARREAERAWNKLNPSPELIETIMDAVEKQKGSEEWQKDEGKFIPYPANWLRGRRWEDQVKEVKDSW